MNNQVILITPGLLLPTLMRLMLSGKRFFRIAFTRSPEIKKLSWLLPESIGIILDLGHIIVQYVEMHCSAPMKSLQALVDGQVFLKRCERML